MQYNNRKSKTISNLDCLFGKRNLEDEIRDFYLVAFDLRRNQRLLLGHKGTRL